MSLSPSSSPPLAEPSMPLLPLHSPRPVSTSIPLTTHAFLYGLSLLGMLCCGSGYAFGAISSSLKTQFHLSQSEVDILGAVNTIGANSGPIIGILIAVFSTRQCAFLGLVLGTIGFIGCSMAAAGAADSSSPFAFLASASAFGSFWLLCGFASSMIYSLLLQVNVHNIPPKYRSVSLSTLVSLYGLTSAVLTSIYVKIFGGDQMEKFFILLTVFFASISSLIVLFIRLLPVKYDGKSEESESEGDNQNNGSASASGVRGANQDESGSAAAENGNSFQGKGESHGSNGVGPTDYLSLDDALGNSPSPNATANSNSINFLPATADPRRPNVRDSFRQALRAGFILVHSPLFWSLFLLFMLIAQGGYVILTNIGQMTQALNNGIDDPEFTRNAIIVFSICNCFGRICMGFSDFLPIRRGYFLLISSFLVSFGHFLTLFTLKDGDKSTLYYPCIFVGLGYGSLWANVPVLTSDLFSRAYFSLNFGWLTISPAIATLVFNVFVGKLYENATPEGQGKDCIGTECFRSSHLMSGIVAASASLIVLWISPKTPMAKRNNGGAAH